MVSELFSGSNGPGSSPARGRCVVFLDKALYPSLSGKIKHFHKLIEDYVGWVESHLKFMKL